MIGNLVVVEGYPYKCVGKVLDTDMNLGMVLIKILHTKYIHPDYPNQDKSTLLWAFESNIIKKSSRPVKMKQQLGLEEEQQPTENTWTTNEDERLDVITREDIRDKMVALNRKGLGKQLIEILNKYGADKVSALSEEHYLEVMAEMEALENESIA